MSIFTRVRDITKATLHEILDHLEDPVSMLNQYMRNIEKEISRAELALAHHLALEKQFKTHLEETEHRIDKRRRQAQLAVENSQDDMARKAIYDKQMAEEKLAQLQQQYDALCAKTHILREHLQELKDKYEEMINQKASLSARASAAQTIKRMNVVLCSMDTESAAKGFARMAERIRAMEVDAEVSRHIRKTYDPGVARSNEKVEEELNQLKSNQSPSMEKASTNS